ncbi:type I-E CRISPR-associated protein Cas6/Cse3/CasE [Streptomyces rubrogriseus]|uniref:type I-E CRISPR-associated protein Cas6/Cse3/CasE n=1 Tax=Streptomyces rubrogriseus TaxID=194673 RepID=UPI00356A2810
MTSLSRLILDPGHPAVRADLADVDSLHKTLMRLVSDHAGPTPRARAGLLFRTEPGPDPVLLVQTANPPDLTALPAHYGTGRTLDLTPLLNSLTPGRTVRYRITAAPTVARSAGNPTPTPSPESAAARSPTSPATTPSPGGSAAPPPQDSNPSPSPPSHAPFPAPA